MAIVTKKKKKGFTITELVIVIAVIAILASVMIVSYTSVLSSANETAALEEMKAEWTVFMSEAVLGNVSNNSGEVDADDIADEKFVITYDEDDDDGGYQLQIDAGVQSGVFTNEDDDFVSLSEDENYTDVSTYGYEYTNTDVAIYFYSTTEE